MTAPGGSLAKLTNHSIQYIVPSRRIPPSFAGYTDAYGDGGTVEFGSGSAGLGYKSLASHDTAAHETAHHATHDLTLGFPNGMGRQAVEEFLADLLAVASREWKNGNK